MAYVPVSVSDEELARLEEKHEDIIMLRGGERAPWVMVLRRPTRQETLAFKQHAKKNQESANEALIRRITVAPQGDDLERQIERWPLLCDAAANNDAFQDFIGATVSEQQK